MNKIHAATSIYIGNSTILNAGRGVFANKRIPAGQTIEICPIIFVPLSDSANHSVKGLLTDYFFYFADGLAMVLGFGSLYNHSYKPNATYIKKPADLAVEFVAIAAIKAGEEITVNYNNGDPRGTSQPMNRGVPPA